MALSQKDRRIIVQVIAEAMQESTCKCALSQDAQQELSHFMGMVKDLGKGDRAEGIETMRSLLKWWAKFHGVVEKIGAAFVYTFAATIVGAIAGLLWLGLKVKIGK